MKKPFFRAGRTPAEGELQPLHPRWGELQTSRYLDHAQLLAAEGFGLIEAEQHRGSALAPTVPLETLRHGSGDPVTSRTVD